MIKAKESYQYVYLLVESDIKLNMIINNIDTNIKQIIKIFLDSIL